MIAIDLYFLINGAFDLILLSGTGIITGERVRMKRALGAAAVGALWSCLALWGRMTMEITGAASFAGSAVTYLAIPWGMCRIAFEGSRRRRAEQLVAFYLVSGLISGWMLLLKYAGIRMPSWISMPVCGGISVIIWRIFEKRKEERALYYQVLLIYEGRQQEVTAFLDSGNRLTAMGGEPVHILSPSVWKVLIGEEPWEEGHPVPLVYQTVGQEAAVMPGVRIDEARVYLQEGTGVIVVSRPMVGLGAIELDSGGRYQMLLNPAVFW